MSEGAHLLLGHIGAKEALSVVPGQRLVPVIRRQRLLCLGPACVRAHLVLPQKLPDAPNRHHLATVTSGVASKEASFGILLDLPSHLAPHCHAWRHFRPFTYRWHSFCCLNHPSARKYLQVGLLAREL